MSDTLQRAQALNIKLSKTILGPDWTPAEERMLSKLSGVGYSHADDAEKAVWAALKPLMQSARGDDHKMRVLDEIMKQKKLAGMALRQIGYNARASYDQRW